MNHTANMVGLGFFAKSQTLQQRFRKVLKNFIWAWTIYPCA